MHPLIDLLVARMASTPEDFFYDASTDSSRLGIILRKAKELATPEEKALLEEASHKVEAVQLKGQKDKLHAVLMEAIVSGDEPEKTTALGTWVQNSTVTTWSAVPPQQFSLQGKFRMDYFAASDTTVLKHV